MTHCQEHSIEVDRHHFPPVLERGLDQRGRGGDTGVGYYDVQSAELFDRSGDEILDLLFVGDISCDSDSSVDRVRHCLCSATVDVGDHDPRALRPERPGNGGADSGTCAGDNCNFVREKIGHVSVPLQFSVGT